MFFLLKRRQKGLRSLKSTTFQFSAAISTELSEET